MRPPLPLARQRRARDSDRGGGMSQRSSQSTPREDTRTKRASLTSGMGFAGLGFLASLATGLMTSVALARLYEIRVVGEFALAYAPLGVVWTLSTVREQPALVRRLVRLQPRDPLITGVFFSVLCFSTLLTIVVSAAVLGVTYFLFRGPVDHPELFLPACANIVGYVVFTNVGWNLDRVFTSYGDGRRLFRVRMAQALAYLVLLVALRTILSDVWGPIVAMGVAAGLALVLEIRLVTIWMPLRVSGAVLMEGLRALPEIIRFALKLTPGSLASGFSGQLGTWLLGALTPLATLGAYNRATSITMRLNDLNWRISEMLFPALVVRHREQRGLEFNQALTDTIRYAVICLALPGAVLGGAAPSVMAIFGEKFRSGAPVLAIALLGPIFVVVNSLQQVALTAVDRPTTTSTVAIVNVVVNLAASVPLTLALGIVGPAIAMVLGTVVATMLSFLLLRRHAHEAFVRLWPVRSMVAVVLSYAGGFFAARMLATALPALSALPICVAGGALAYVGLLVPGGAFLPRDRDRLALGVRRLPGRWSDRLAFVWRER